MREPLPTGQLRQAAARLVGQTLEVLDDVTDLARLVATAGIELSAATRHAIELELHDAALAVHRVALSVREERRGCDARGGRDCR